MTAVVDDTDWVGSGPGYVLLNRTTHVLPTLGACRELAGFLSTKDSGIICPCQPLGGLPVCFAFPDMRPRFPCPRRLA